MPIIKSAKKRAKQNLARKVKNYELRTMVKTNMKKVLSFVDAKDQTSASKALSVAYKVIDTASKKNVLHQNNAARKKSRLAKAVATIQKK
jgi:small subunit ribosomal protein S20